MVSEAMSSLLLREYEELNNWNIFFLLCPPAASF